VGVVGAERHHQPARHLVGEDVLQLPEEGGLGTAANARILAANRGQVDHVRGAEVEPFDVDLELRPAAAE
jgi:hypothetical protein